MHVQSAPPSSSAAPSVSVVTVIDYKAGQASSWDDLRATLEGLAAQDHDGPVEVLLVEAKEASLSIPPDLLEIYPALKVVRVDARTSYDLKNAGAEAASGDWVVMLDADCAPHPRWLGAFVRHATAHPEAAAISGRTLYKTEGLLPKVFALLDRCYVDGGEEGTTRAISNNNGAFARHVILEYPLKNDVGPFGSKPHSDLLLSKGKTLRVEPDMIAYHGYGGWEMAREVRKHTGYSMARYRIVNPQAKYAPLYRLGPIGVPLIVGMSMVDSCLRCVRYHADYDIPWYQIPYAWGVAIRSHAMEVPGLLLAMRGGSMGTADAFR